MWERKLEWLHTSLMNPMIHFVFAAVERSVIVGCEGGVVSAVVPGNVLTR